MKIENLNEPCPMKGTRHEKACPLINIMDRMPDYKTCPFRPDCVEFLEQERLNVERNGNEQGDETGG